jgi:ATP-dependent helicase/nuclease subunit B
MPVPFLRLVAEHLHQVSKDTPEKLCVVLPSKRGAVFLKQQVAAVYGKTVWLPQILTPDELMERISGLRIAGEADLICLLYESYLAGYGKEAESFDAFLKWGDMILRDFNEIDKALAEASSLYDNLRHIREIENWSLGADILTPLQQNYLRFMESLGGIYKHYSSTLRNEKIGYQGLVYRSAAMNEDPFSLFEQERFIFCGFNALSHAEESVFLKFKRSGKSDFLWDADTYYLDDESQEAGHFLRKNIAQFGNAIKTGSDFSDQRIRIISVPGVTGQAQAAGRILAEWEKEGNDIHTALVLPDEKLLWPELLQMPAMRAGLNITMEYPLRISPAWALLKKLSGIQLAYSRQSRREKNIYHKDLLALLRDPLFIQLARVFDIGDIESVAERLTSENLAFIGSQALSRLTGDNAFVQALLKPADSVSAYADALTQAFLKLHELGLKNADPLMAECVLAVITQLNRLKDLSVRFSWLNEIRSFHQLLQQLADESGVSFSGEPLEGIQVMGMLETRTLDFDRVLMLSVNEGILPAPGNSVSFLPNDLKKHFGLPLYDEKEAVFAYHFYRLLQRSAEVVLIHDSMADTFGKGEKSRFITQLMFEIQKARPGIRIESSVASSDYKPSIPERIRIEKTSPLLARLDERFGSGEEYHGLSPSAIIAYKDCSLKFYFRYGAGIRESELLEESAEAGTFGSILHLGLEKLYRPLIGKPLNNKDLRERLPLIQEIVRESFMAHFPSYNGTGKNYLQEEVIRTYLDKLLRSDIKALDSGVSMKIAGLEGEYKASLDLGGKTLIVKGKIDRVDVRDGTLRIVDYKSSVADQDKFAFGGFESLFQDRNFNKQLQLLLYSWLVYRNDGGQGKINACVIPFKAGTDSPCYISGPDKKPLSLEPGFFLDFEAALREYVVAMFDESRHFIQTDDIDVCEYCAYNAMCNIHS